MNQLNRFISGVVLAAAWMVSSTSVMALSPPPPQPGDELLPLLYEALGGEDWLRNDGWLDPDVHWCDWYGITCGNEYWPGLFELAGIDLSANNLHGTIEGELAERLFAHELWVAPDHVLDLSDNAITGTLPYFPEHTWLVDLSGNLFSGALPEISGQLDMPERPRRLLARNQFEGSVPESWQQLELSELDLADNQLDDGYLNAFSAMSRFNPGHLNLAGNLFSGELPTAIFPANLNRRDSGNTGGGLNLCFNDFVIDNPDVEQWVARRHAGGPDYEQCLGRERLPLDATISGSWFNPQRAGEGVSLMLLDNGSPLLYHFGFDAQGRQQWLFEVGVGGDRFMQWDRLFETQGTFNAGLRFDSSYPFIRSIARFRLDRVGSDTLHLYRHYYDVTGCGEWEHADPNRPPPPGLCVPSLISDRMDYQRLSQLAGSDCDNGAAYQEYSGAWFNPDRAGEGFIIEVLPDQQAVVYWFTYKPDGSREQVWLIGQGEVVVIAGPATAPPGFVRGRIEIETMHQPLGGQYGPGFDPEQIDYINWGSLQIDIDQSDGAVVHWESHIDGYGTGSYELERLAMPKLAECD